jgi:hypothetical protein
MRSCLAPALGALGLAVLLSGLHRFSVLPGAMLLLGYGLGYAVVAILLLTVWRRCFSIWPPALHRMVALLGSACLALIDVLLAGYAAEAGQQLFFSALLGAALVQVLARMRLKPG